MESSPIIRSGLRACDVKLRLWAELLFLVGYGKPKDVCDEVTPIPHRAELVR